MDKKSGKINEMDKKSPFSDGMKIRFRRKNLHDAEAGKIFSGTGETCPVFGYLCNRFNILQNRNRYEQEKPDRAGNGPHHRGHGGNCTQKC